MREELLRALIEHAKKVGDYCPEHDSYLLFLIDNAVEELAIRKYPYSFQSEKKAKKAKESTLALLNRRVYEIAKWHFDFSGEEGAIAFSEGGSSVSFENAGTPESYFAGIVPESRIL